MNHSPLQVKGHPRSDPEVIGHYAFHNKDLTVEQRYKLALKSSDHWREAIAFLICESITGKQMMKLIEASATITKYHAVLGKNNMSINQRVGMVRQILNILDERQVRLFCEMFGKEMTISEYMELMGDMF